jgi:SAM-dependent methyltransferase
VRKLAARAFERAMRDNLANVEQALAAAAPVDALLDVGCDDGVRTLAFAAAARAASVHGVETVAEQAERARARGIEVAVADVETGLPYDDGSFDAVVSNQLLEHVHDTDRLVAELRRVLRPGGVAVVSTENLASWHNVLALVLGWQPFSLTNVSEVGPGLGNPAAVHRGSAQTRPRSWQHVRVFAHRGLRELFTGHGLAVERLLGAGYYPLPSRFGRHDPRHAAFLTVVARRP